MCTAAPSPERASGSSLSATRCALAACAMAPRLASGCRAPCMPARSPRSAVQRGSPSPLAPRQWCSAIRSSVSRPEGRRTGASEGWWWGEGGEGGEEGEVSKKRNKSKQKPARLPRRSPLCTRVRSRHLASSPFPPPRFFAGVWEKVLLQRAQLVRSVGGERQRLRPPAPHPVGRGV